MENEVINLPNGQAIYEIAQRLLTTCSLHDKIHIIMTCLEECLAWDRGWLGLVDKKRGVLKGEAYFGENIPPRYAIVEIPLSPELKNPAIIAVLEKSPAVVKNPMSDPRCLDISVGGKSKITKKGKIKFTTSEENMVSYDRSLIVGGPKGDGDIGRVS